VDVRGRGNSGGTFLPFENEGRDAHDAVEWLAAQPWSNGKVAMWGGSYAGFDQWAALQQFPQRHYLVMGPWDHAGTRTPSREVGGLGFGPASLLDLNALHKAWYDWTLKDGPRPEFLEKRIA